MGSIEAVCKCRLQPFHAHREISLGRFNGQMTMMAQKTVGIEPPTIPQTGLGKAFFKGVAWPYPEKRGASCNCHDSVRGRPRQGIHFLSDEACVTILPVNGRMSRQYFNNYGMTPLASLEW